MTQDDVLGANLFAYCSNNPVNMYDPSGYKAIDITSKLMKLMRKNALKFAAYIITHCLFRGILYGLIKSFKYFYKNSKSGGAWDLKALKGWKLAKGDWFVFKGKKLRFDDPGNIHFGYVGSVMFPVSVLRAGAGFYQIFSGTSKWKYWWTLFDDPRDSAMISYGHNLFIEDLRKTIINIMKFSGFRIF